jgi:hypothetical protein
MSCVQSASGPFRRSKRFSIVNINKNTMARARSARKTWTCAQNNNDVKQCDQSNNNGIAKGTASIPRRPNAILISQNCMACLEYLEGGDCRAQFQRLPWNVAV